MSNIELIPVTATETPFLLPLFSCLVPAGFSSPATDHIEEEAFDLNRLLLQHPHATFLVRIVGESIAGAEIHTGDLLAVDKQMEANHGHIVVAVVEGRTKSGIPMKLPTSWTNWSKAN